MDTSMPARDVSMDVSGPAAGSWAACGVEAAAGPGTPSKCPRIERAAVAGPAGVTTAWAGIPEGERRAGHGLCTTGGAAGEAAAGEEEGSSAPPPDARRHVPRATFHTRTVPSSEQEAIWHISVGCQSTPVTSAPWPSKYRGGVAGRSTSQI
eukprot:scaffold5038_cov112-Isochrysis_galbana.AAC.2